jgi:hypothetical protein
MVKDYRHSAGTDLLDLNDGLLNKAEKRSQAAENYMKKLGTLAKH